MPPVLSRSVWQVRLKAEVQEYFTNFKSCDHFIINPLLFSVKAAEKTWAKFRIRSQLHPCISSVKVINYTFGGRDH